jgi:hypothetical protein
MFEGNTKEPAHSSPGERERPFAGALAECPGLPASGRQVGGDESRQCKL